MSAGTAPVRNPHQAIRARSSAGEHYVDIVGVTGSIPVAPTIHQHKGLLVVGGQQYVNLL